MTRLPWRVGPFIAVVLVIVVPTSAKSADETWIFTSPKRPPVPTVRAVDQIQNPIDAFVLASLEEEKLSLSSRADRLARLRRVTIDLTGLPPTLEEQEAFLNDSSPLAYEKVVERLLSSPRYGERWAQHWLDLVRYAETNGFKADELRPDAFRYRDYVIQSLNRDVPYDRFVRQQIAGDELEPDNPDAVIATGYLRLYPDESNAANLEQRRQEILNDLTDVTGQALLALTFGCAKCHDHKFDPITQKDYYSLQAAFAAAFPRDDRWAATPSELRQYEKKLAAWEAKTKSIREQMEKLVAKKRQSIANYTLERFRKEIQISVRTPPAKRTPYQQQIAAMAQAQMDRKAQSAPKQMKADLKKKYAQLEKKLQPHLRSKPRSPRTAMAMFDVGRVAPPTHRLKGGDWRKTLEEVSLSFPEFLGKSKVDTSLPQEMNSTGRRAALARWLTKREHPLTARVIANRLWQHHFGKGIIGTANDFGAMGEPATHPELVDWLAVELVEHNWSLKHLHRLMVTSRTYQQTSLPDPTDANHVRAKKIDPDNELLWRANRRRLEGEALRDAMLTLTDDLNERMFGKSAKPKLPPKISKYAWKADSKAEDRQRRSIYVFAKRNMRFPLFDTFDLPDMHNSCARRAKTTTAPQALFLLNGTFTRERAQKWSDALRAQFPSDQKSLVKLAYQQAWCRIPTTEEVSLAVRFLDSQTKRYQQRGRDNGRELAMLDFCHGLLNTNEFLYVD